MVTLLNSSAWCTAERSELRLVPYFIDPRTFANVGGALSLLTCKELGGQVLTGVFWSSQSEAAALLGYSFRE